MRAVICQTLFKLAALGCFASVTWAGSVFGTTPESPEDFRIEVLGSAWTLDSSGNVQDSGNQVDLRNDLGFGQGVETFYGKLVVKPGRKHRIVIEGDPFNFTGSKTSTRTFTYAGQVYSFNQQLNTSANLEYIFGGYQYDFLSGHAGHLGASVGGAYLNATGQVTAPQVNVSSSRSQQIGMPLAGLEFRIFPIPGRPVFDIDGGVRGMDFGGYGHYVEFDVNGGLWLGRHIGLQGGYRTMTAYLHDNSTNLNGSLNIRLSGPTASLLFKW